MQTNIRQQQVASICPIIFQFRAGGRQQHSASTGVTKGDGSRITMLPVSDRFKLPCWGVRGDETCVRISADNRSSAPGPTHKVPSAIPPVNRLPSLLVNPTQRRKAAKVFDLYCGPLCSVCAQAQVPCLLGVFASWREPSADNLKYYYATSRPTHG